MPFDFGQASDQHPVRRFTTGATRDLDADKPDFEGFMSPLVVQAFGEYMTENRHTAAGVRDSDNWQKGIPLAEYVKSIFRHFVALWAGHRAEAAPREMVVDALGVMFNAQGYIHEQLKTRPEILGQIRAVVRERRAVEAQKRNPAKRPGATEGSPI